MSSVHDPTTAGIPVDVTLESRGTALAYRPDIDGLRAVAVVPVILFHLDKTMFPAGYLGVDVFFVISGFLITSLLMREWARTGTLSLTAFWRRRVLRIVPAMLVMVAVTFLAGQLVLFAPERYYLSVNSAAALLSVANFTHWINYGSYWGAAADSSPLLHTWSLSVEEQFYFFYPLAILLILKYARRWLLSLVLAGLVISFAAYCWGVGAKPAPTFYLLPTRAWELAAGAIAALVNFQRGHSAIGKPIWAAVGLALVAAGYVLIRAEGLSYFLWVPVFGSAIMLAFNQGPGCLATRALSFPMLVGIGKISYSLYLWHWPVLILSRSLSDRYGLSLGPALLLVVIVMVSLASYWFIERPARHAVAIVPALVVGLVGLAALTFSVRDLNTSEMVDQFSPTRWEGHIYSVSPDKTWPAYVQRRMAGIDVAESTGTDDAYALGGIQRLYGGPVPEVVVFGDSHGLMWAPGIDAAAKELNLSVAYFTADGTRAFFEIPLDPAATGTQFFSDVQMRDFNRARLAALREWRPKFVVVGARWATYSAADALDVLGEVEAIGAQAILIGDPPRLGTGDRSTPQYLAYTGAMRPGVARPISVDEVERDKASVVLSSILEACGKCTAIQTADIFLEGDAVAALRDAQVMYIDDDHLSSAGALLLSDRFVKALSGGGSGEER